MPDLPSVCKVNAKKSQPRPAKRRNIPLSPAAPIEAHMAVRRPISNAKIISITNSTARNLSSLEIKNRFCQKDRSPRN